VQIIRQLSGLRERTKLIRESGRSIALVPTMGALHDGHMALVELAKRQADHVIVSLFVNPRQFGPNEDFEKYPRSEEADAARLADAGVTSLWMPPVSEVYPDGFSTSVVVAGLDNVLCGAARPGHFEGVATIVAKLLNQVRPDVAVFGEKDWQQLVIIRRMVRDLDMDVELVGMPILRDTDGLALSSRNAYLSEAERKTALALPQALRRAAAGIESGGAIERALAAAKAEILSAGFGTVDYVALVDAGSLQPLVTLDREARLLGAARIGATRLIDNFPVIPKNPTMR
jgi:pantoate--beta-alanine ligase